MFHTFKLFMNNILVLYIKLDLKIDKINYRVQFEHICIQLKLKKSYLKSNINIIFEIYIKNYSNKACLSYFTTC